MEKYLEWLKDDPGVIALNNKQEGLASLTDNQEALILATSFVSKPRNLVVIKNNLYSAQQLYNRLYPLLKDNVLLFSMEESLRVEEIAASPELYAQQMETLTTIIMTDKPHIIISHPNAITRYIPTKETFKKHLLEIKINQQYSMDCFKNILLSSGYRQASKIDQPLTFAQRGSIIDVFSIQYDNPIRVEFFGDEIDSIRFFDINTQRTIKTVDSITISPASLLIYEEDFASFKEKVLVQLTRDKYKCDYPLELETQVKTDLDYLEKGIYEHYLYRYYSFFDNTANLFDYFDECDVVVSTLEACQTNIENYTIENFNYLKEQFENGKALQVYETNADFLRCVSKYKPYKIATFVDSKHNVSTNIEQLFIPIQSLDWIINDINQQSETHKVFISISQTQQETLKEKVNNKVTFIDEVFSEGFKYKDIIVLTSKELYGTKTHLTRFTNKFNEATILEDYQDLNVGDYIVHNQYGIGKYQGIVQKTVKGITKDYLYIVYKDNDLLLVPLEQFKQVRKYVGSQATNVRLSKLGSGNWSKTKEKIKEDINVMTERLMELYSVREQNIGFSFDQDDQEMLRFEGQRDFELTADQQLAINEVKKDMESNKPMDRLLCGDVGFGKTEVAMVAAFKAVSNAKQVAYLCPTTILSRQHYHTFIERFKGFPVRIALLNRFVSEEEQKKILRDVKQGKVDILIGTHRILSKDVDFEDLGLLIIDEEQRFGVQAKEKIKEYKNTIDALSLSATPIPRTMQMSLTGIMSLSLINTAPKDRLPVQTYVVEKNDSLIKEVIQRELARNGQVFYLHNNINTIYQQARKIESMIPNSKVAVGHGQMDRDTLEEVMYKFVGGEYDVMVCTTIIETGIDIPNANTIIIDNADNFGLAQLYQIRGRVGRSDRIAYAYLMYDGQRQLTEVATKRLQAIKDFTQLGSGYKVAMRDLTIRGAGDLLGEKQAGFINTVGMDLYLELLQQAIDEKKGIIEKEIVSNKKINQVDSYIPEQFSNDYEKIALYQRIDKINSLTQLTALQEEIIDRYGHLPSQVKLLFSKKHIELLLNSDNIDQFDEYEKECRITLSQSYCDNLDGVKFFENMNNISSEIKLKYMSNKITLTIPKRKNWLDIINKVVSYIERDV